MDLRTYITALPGKDYREDFARRCGTSLGHLRNVAYGTRRANAKLASAIEMESKGAVTRGEAAPHLAWEIILAAPKPRARKHQNPSKDPT